LSKEECRLTHDKKEVTGFAKVTLGDRATPCIWTEGTAGYILAGRVMKDDEARLTFEFGYTIGNRDETVLYIDDVHFAALNPVAGPGLKPVVFPQWEVPQTS